MASSIHILELPIEILDLILRSLIVSSSPIFLCPCTPSPINPLPFLLIHPRIHAVAAPLFYTANEFILDATGSHAQHVRRLLKSPLASLEAVAMNSPRRHLIPQQLHVRPYLLTQTEALRRIIRLDLRFDRLRGWLDQSLFPTIQSMIVQGSLEHLSTWVQSATEPRHHTMHRAALHEQRSADGDGTGERGLTTTTSTSDDLDMFTRPPLSGLLRVLADPYLRTARLWVDARHAPAWCRFHSRDDCPPGEKVDGQPARARAREKDMAVEIDWRAIVRAVDPEGRELSVAWTEDPDVMRRR